MIRKYLTPKSKQVIVNVPDEFVNTGIELLIIPIHKIKSHSRSINLTETLNNIFKVAASIRIPKEINIL